MKIINAILVAFLLSIAVFAQSRNIIADGNPPLTQVMINRLTTLMQWSLDTDFTDEERNDLRRAVVSCWEKGDQKSIKSILDMLAFEEKWTTSSEDQKQTLQPQIQAGLLREFEKDISEPLNKVLFAAYSRSHANSKSDSGSGDLLANLIGRWQVSHGNSMTTQNVYTGKIGDANGMIAEYDIKPNGSVIFSFYLSQNNYGCTTKIKTSKIGRVSVSGNRLSFDYDKGTTTSSDSCNAKNNYTKNLGKTGESFSYELKRENGKPQFCFANDQLKDCAVKM